MSGNQGQNIPYPLQYSFARPSNAWNQQQQWPRMAPVPVSYQQPSVSYSAIPRFSEMTSPHPPNSLVRQPMSYQQPSVSYSAIPRFSEMPSPHPPNSLVRQPMLYGSSPSHPGWIPRAPIQQPQPRLYNSRRFPLTQQPVPHTNFSKQSYDSKLKNYGSNCIQFTNKGHCMRGSNCLWRHFNQKTGKIERTKFSPYDATMDFPRGNYRMKRGMDTNNKDSVRRLSSNTTICWDYNTSSGCKRKDSCKYKHEFLTYKFYHPLTKQIIDPQIIQNQKFHNDETRLSQEKNRNCNNNDNDIKADYLDTNNAINNTTMKSVEEYHQDNHERESNIPYDNQ